MKKMLFAFLLLASNIAFGQNWDSVSIDSVVTCKLPKGFQTDTVNGKINYRATSGFGTMLIFKTDDNPRVIPDIEKDRHLKAYYDDYIKNIRNSAKGSTITDEKDTIINELRFKDFKLQTDSGSGKQYREFRIFHVNAATYTFEFLYNDIQIEYAKPESADFFNSIKVDEKLDRADQYTHNDNPKPGADKRRNLITGLVIGGVVLLILIFVFIRRKK